MQSRCLSLYNCSQVHAENRVGGVRPPIGGVGINFPGWRKGYNKKPTPGFTLIYGFAIISALIAPVRKVYLPP